MACLEGKCICGHITFGNMNYEVEKCEKCGKKTTIFHDEFGQVNNNMEVENVK